jgi:O-antigen ligase
LKDIVIKIDKRYLQLDVDKFNLFVVKPLFLFLIYFGVYSRTSGFIGFTGGQTTVLVSFGLFMAAIIHTVFFNKSLKVSNFAFLITIFFVCSAVLPFFSTFVFQLEPMRIVRYSFEVGTNFFMFFSVYYFVREKVITPKFFLYSVAILAVIAASGYLKSALQSVSIYRIYGMSGLNTLGNSFALGIFAWILIIYQKSVNNWSFLNRYISYACLFSLFLALLFTGTRSALIALFFGIMLFQFLGMRSKKFTRYVFLFFTVLTILIVIIALNIDMTNLLRRFSSESIIRMALIRFSIYANSVTDLTLLDFLFGRPDYYIFSNQEDDFINPHNLFLATIRYNGIFIFLILSLIFIGLFRKYFVLFKKHSKQKYFRVNETSILILFMMVVIYTMFSGGRITRSFNFFITLGYAAGYLEMFKNLKSYEEYKKLIV